MEQGKCVQQSWRIGLYNTGNSVCSCTGVSLYTAQGIIININNKYNNIYGIKLTNSATLPLL